MAETDDSGWGDLFDKLHRFKACPVVFLNGTSIPSIASPLIFGRGFAFGGLDTSQGAPTEDGRKGQVNINC